MSSKNTQAKILKTALSLFNQNGTGKVSVSKIAEECGISKGHMNYHYKNKEEIILAIFYNLAKELDLNLNWYTDDDFSVQHLSNSFMRNMEMNYKYRFFYRELPSLLRSNELIQRRFIETRSQRIKAFNLFVERSAKAGVYRSTQNNQDLKDNVTATWVFADNWINYLEASEEKVNAKGVRTGYRIMKVLLKPSLTDKAYLSLPDAENLPVPFLDDA